MSEQDRTINLQIEKKELLHRCTIFWSSWRVKSDGFTKFMTIGQNQRQWNQITHGSLALTRILCLSHRHQNLIHISHGYLPLLLFLFSNHTTVHATQVTGSEEKIANKQPGEGVRSNGSKKWARQLSRLVRTRTHMWLGRDQALAPFAPAAVATATAKRSCGRAEVISPSFWRCQRITTTKLTWADKNF